MKQALTLILFFLVCSTLTHGQKGLGLSGKVFSDPGTIPIAGKKVFIVIDQSAAPYVTNLNRELITQPDGSFSLYIPNIPDTIIPLEIMVYTFDCGYHRKGFLVTFNENDVFASDININICNISTPLIHNPIIALAPDINCPTYTLLETNDSLSKKYLIEDFQWKLNGNVVHSGGIFDTLLTEENNNLELSRVFTDSLTGFFYDSVSFNKNLVFPDTMFHIFGGNVMFDNYPTTTGTAILLANAGNNYFATDTMQYQQYGYFYFNHIPRCRYSVKITESDQGLSEPMIPTYLGNEAHWTSATFLSVADDVFSGNINLIEGESMSGSGQINGQVAMYPSDGYDVILYNLAMEPLNYVSADNNGYFSFSGLSFGSYILYSEKFSCMSLLGYATISATNPFADVVLSNATALADANAQEITIFPNPASDHINFDIDLESPVRIVSADGSFVKEGFALNGQLFVGDLPSGMYFLQIRSEELNFTTKLMIVH